MPSQMGSKASRFPS